MCYKNGKCRICLTFTYRVKVWQMGYLPLVFRFWTIYIIYSLSQIWEKTFFSPSVILKYILFMIATMMVFIFWLQ